MFMNTNTNTTNTIYLKSKYPIQFSGLAIHNNCTNNYQNTYNIYFIISSNFEMFEIFFTNSLHRTKIMKLAYKIFCICRLYHWFEM